MTGSVGIVLVGHGNTASDLLAAARGILGPEALAGVAAVDAGAGETPALAEALCRAIDDRDEGRGVLVLVDVLGASPSRCAVRESGAHRVRLVAGLNLAMLLKVAGLDRHALSLDQMAEAVLDAGHRSVRELVPELPEDPQGGAER